MLARTIGLLLASAAIVGFATTAGASSTTPNGDKVWTHMKDELTGKDLVFYGHDLHAINHKWATTGRTGFNVDEKVWEMPMKKCTPGGRCNNMGKTQVWIKSSAPGRYHAFYKVDGERWQRAKPVPEPTAAAVFALGLGVVGARLRRTRQ